MTGVRMRQAGLLVVFVFLLFSMPRLNIRLGPIPLYAIDFVAALLVYQIAFSTRQTERVVLPFRTLVIVIAALVILSEFAVVAYGGSLLDATYISMRYFLAFGIMFAVPKVVRTARDVELILKGIALALLISSVMMILSSLPQTRAIASILLSISYLEPSSSAADRLLSWAEDKGARGRTWIGVSILSGAFISIAWPLVAYLRTLSSQLSALWSITALLAVTLSPVAIMMSYSRQAAAGAILILAASLIIPIGGVRRKLLRPFILSAVVVLTIGVGSSMFLFDRYVNRFAAVIENPIEDEREAARFLSYVVPFKHVVDHPQFFFVGVGSTAERSGKITIELSEENHSLLGAGYFAHGMISTLMLLFLIFAALRYSNWHRARSMQIARHARDWSQSLFLAYLPILPMAAFAPALGQEVRGMYIYMLLLGLLGTLRNPVLIASLATRGKEAEAKSRAEALTQRPRRNAMPIRQKV